MKPSNRSLPFIRALIHVKQNKDKIAVLKKFPKFVLDDIVEVLYNVLQQNCKISPKQKSVLQAHKNAISSILSSAVRRKSGSGGGGGNKSTVLKSRRTSRIYKQKGGFLGAILPIIASVLGKLFS